MYQLIGRGVLREVADTVAPEPDSYRFRFTLAVQFARWKGARVFATASGDDGLATVRRLGADEAVDGR